MSNLEYDSFAVSDLKEVLTAVKSACFRLEINFFLVGAIARNIWFLRHGGKIEGTKDIDLGIYVATAEAYNLLRMELVTTFHFSESTTNPFCLFAPGGRAVDLLPFGEIQGLGHILVQHRGLISIEEIQGFQEVYEYGKQAVMLSDDQYFYCAIPGMVILKLIAFDDRPLERIKDIDDIHAILSHYQDFEHDFLLNNYLDLFDGERVWQEIAMIALGREMGKVLEGNSALSERVIGILRRAIKGESRLLVHLLQRNEKGDKKNALNLEMNGLIHLLEGLSGNIPS